MDYIHIIIYGLYTEHVYNGHSYFGLEGCGGADVYGFGLGTLV